MRSNLIIIWLLLSFCTVLPAQQSDLLQRLNKIEGILQNQLDEREAQQAEEAANAIAYLASKNGADRTYKHTDWVADVNTHQFRHEFVCMLCMANVPEEISIQIVGHANAQMIHDVYMTLKPEMVQLAKEHLDSYISA